MKHWLLFIPLLMLTLPGKASAQTDTLTGLVVDETGDGLPGASLYFLYETDTAAFLRCGHAEQYGTITDVDGKFFFVTKQKLSFPYLGIAAMGYKREMAPVGTNYIRMIKKPEISYPFQPLGPVIDKGIYVGKPAIYLYPTRKTTVMIKHEFKGTVGTTYPAYGDGWKVIADTDGSLLNTKDNRRYEYLFWDGQIRFPEEHFDFKTGFVVKKEESQAFLWEKLAFIGLNNKEINDFVVYWLPQLEQHAQNFIYFHINDDIDHTSILKIHPEPDSRIRLFMEFKPVDQHLRITPQELKPLPRKGFTMVEWGGAKLAEVLFVQ